MPVGRGQGCRLIPETPRVRKRCTLWSPLGVLCTVVCGAEGEQRWALRVSCDVARRVPCGGLQRGALVV